MAPVKEKSVRDGLNQKDQLELDAIASILGKKGDEELTRSAMDKLILDKVGHHVSDSIMAEIFQECDTDNSGTVSVDEFGNYIRNLKGSTTRGEKVRYVVCKLTFSMDWWAFIMFLIALLTSVTLNVYSRLGILPRDFNFYGMNALLYVFGCYAYVARIYDRISKDYDLIEIVNGKIITWVESLDEESGVVSSKELTPHQLFTLLEKEGLYVPYDTFYKVFRRIDKDKSGTLSLSEVKDYAAKERARGPLTRLQFHRKVLRRCYLSLDYWLNWGWVMGSVCFAVVAFKEDLSETESLHIAGAGCILFLISAFFQHVTNYKSTGRFLDRAEELNAVFLSIVKEQSMRTSIMRRGGNNMAISDASMRRVSENAEEDSNIKEACHQVFESFDRQGKDGAGDGNLDFIELYEALSGFGIVIELDVLRFIFNQADVNGDKSLQPEEFVRYIFSIKRSKTPQERRREIIRAMSKTTYFWMCWLQVFAGFVITLVNYYDMSAETARNWSLAGNFSWMIPVIWYLWVIVRGHVDYFEASSRSKIHLKEFFLSEATKTQHTSTSVLISARVLYRGAMPPH